MAREVETLPKELEGVIDKRNRLLLSAVDICVFSNVHFASPVVDLCALVVAVPSEASEALGL